MLEQWNRLNPTEQYFDLLEAWWRFGRAIWSVKRNPVPTQKSCLGAWIPGIPPQEWFAGAGPKKDRDPFLHRTRDL